MAAKRKVVPKRKRRRASPRETPHAHDALPVGAILLNEAYELVLDAVLEHPNALPEFDEDWSAALEQARNTKKRLVMIKPCSMLSSQHCGTKKNALIYSFDCPLMSANSLHVCWTRGLDYRLNSSPRGGFQGSGILTSRRAFGTNTLITKIIILLVLTVRC